YLQGPSGAAAWTAKSRAVVPGRTKAPDQSTMNLISKRHLKALNRTIKRLAQRNVPHIQLKRSSSITADSSLIARKTIRRDGAWQRDEFVSVILKRQLQLVLLALPCLGEPR